MSAVAYARPTLVRVISALLVLVGLAAAVVDAGLLTVFRSALGADPGAFTVGAVGVALVLAVAQAASGVAMYAGRAGARRAAIGICGLNIVAAVVTIVAGAGLAAMTGIALNVVILALLAKHDAPR
jgi:hypothetical protein